MSMLQVLPSATNFRSIALPVVLPDIQIWAKSSVVQVK